MALIFANNASSSLNGAITNVATTVNIEALTSGQFPALGAGDWHPVTVTDGINIEIMRVTARAGAVLTVVRGQEGTTAQAWPTGTQIEYRLTKGALDELASAAILLAKLLAVDGALSGLDADLLDGQHGAFYQNAGNLNAGTLPAARFDDTAHGARGGGTLHALVTGALAGFMAAADKSKIDGIESGATADQTGAEILARLLTVDGTGSGLDADLLDGQHGAAFSPVAAFPLVSAANGATDWNTVTAAGFHASLLGIGNPNHPAAGAYFFAYVIQYGGPATLTQVAFPYGQQASITSGIWWRGLYNFVWTPWQQFIGTVSPTFTGNPTAPTAPAGDNDTTIANTAFVTAAVATTPPTPKLTGVNDGATDWNTLTTAGYRGSLGPSNANAPLSPGYFACLTILHVAGYLTQMAYPAWDVNYGIWTRSCNNSVWSSWRRLAVETAEPRNLITNPAMQVSQQYASALIGAGHPADQWLHAFSTTGAATAQRVAALTPNKSSSRLQFKVTTADAALASTEYWMTLQYIEGVQCAGLGWGSAGARQVVVRFGFKGPAGTYCLSVRNGAVNRSYLAPFTISAGQANTDTEQVFVIPGDTTGVWPTDEDRGLTFGVGFAAGAGGALVGVAGWQAGGMIATAAQTNGLLTVGNTFEVFDVGLYIDPDNTGQPPPWELPDFATELSKCQRYWQTMYGLGSFSPTSGLSYYINTQMGVAPRPGATVSATNSVNSNFTATPGTIAIVAQSVRELRAANATATSGTFGSNYTIDGRM